MNVLIVPQGAPQPSLSYLAFGIGNKGNYNKAIMNSYNSITIIFSVIFTIHGTKEI